MDATAGTGIVGDVVLLEDAHRREGPANVDREEESCIEGSCPGQRLFSGYLFKESSRFLSSRFQRRWAVLTSAGLFYYIDKKEDTLRGKIPVESIAVVRKVFDRAKAGYPHGFSLSSTVKRGKLYVFAAMSAAERDTWMYHLSSCLRTRDGISPTNPDISARRDLSSSSSGWNSTENYKSGLEEQIQRLKSENSMLKIYENSFRRIDKILSNSLDSMENHTETSVELCISIADRVLENIRNSSLPQYNSDEIESGDSIQNVFHKMTRLFSFIRSSYSPANSSTSQNTSLCLSTSTDLEPSTTRTSVSLREKVQFSSTTLGVLESPRDFETGRDVVQSLASSQANLSSSSDTTDQLQGSISHLSPEGVSSILTALQLDELRASCNIFSENDPLSQISDHCTSRKSEPPSIPDSELRKADGEITSFSSGAERTCGQIDLVSTSLSCLLPNSDYNSFLLLLDVVQTQREKFQHLYSEYRCASFDCVYSMLPLVVRHAPNIGQTVLEIFETIEELESSLKSILYPVPLDSIPIDDWTLFFSRISDSQSLSWSTRLPLESVLPFLHSPLSSEEFSLVTESIHACCREYIPLYSLLRILFESNFSSSPEANTSVNSDPQV